MKRIALSSLALAFLCASPASAQTSQSSVVLPTADSSDDLIITALRIPREKLPTGVYWDYQSMLPSRIQYQNSQMFMRCALKTANLRELRAIVDGEPNSATARAAQGWVKITHQGCYPPMGSSGVLSQGTGDMRPVNYVISDADLGRSLVDRGAIVERVLAQYAPDAALTPEMTSDPVVRSRFVAREGYRNRLRLEEDQDALRYASCLVERQPVLATRLIRAEAGTKLAQGLTQALIVEGRSCIGNASQITIDPTIARSYVIDAFYRWVVAARDVDSLIPHES